MSNLKRQTHPSGISSHETNQLLCLLLLLQLASDVVERPGTVFGNCVACRSTWGWPRITGQALCDWLDTICQSARPLVVQWRTPARSGHSTGHCWVQQASAFHGDPEMFLNRQLMDFFHPSVDSRSMINDTTRVQTVQTVQAKGSAACLPMTWLLSNISSRLVFIS